MNGSKLGTMGSEQPQSAAASAESNTPNGEEDLHSSDDEFATISITDELRRLSIDRGNTRFFGKSSGVVLIQTAMDMKKEFNNPPGADLSNQAEGSSQSASDHLRARRPEFWHFEPVSVFLSLRLSSVSIANSSIVGHPQTRGPRTTLPVPGPRPTHEPRRPLLRKHELFPAPLTSTHIREVAR